ncbi:alpha/beta fold hydrolase, partial [Nonomuraea basaltis]|uniref:alpha/beta fold hydrolase n=1 Tax=Nonomuraea basaltis TaxID=2495887 RepID=UPI00110C7195
PDPARPFHLRVVDDYGLRAPFAAPGQVVLVAADDESVKVPTGRYGRRMSGGLEFLPERPRRTFHRPRRRSASRAALRPEGPVQLRIAHAWSRVLDVPLESITLDGNFFELGGGSLAAMRAVMELDGLVSLTDLMRNSTLGPLSMVVQTRLDEGAGADPGLLRALSENPGNARCALVCLPYAGGTAIDFEPLAAALGKADDIGVYSVELPGHDAGHPGEPLLSVREAARLLADEIRTTLAGDVLLWGHCVGSALAVETARLMEAAGSPPLHVFVAGKLLHDAGIMREAVRQADTMSDDDIMAWLAGVTEVGPLTPDQAAFVARVFRHDSRSANAYLLAQAEEGTGATLGVPLTAVYATDDPLTPEYGRRYEEWSLFSAAPRLAEVGPAGHYFCSTAPHAVADLVRSLWKEGH